MKLLMSKVARSKLVQNKAANTPFKSFIRSKYFFLLPEIPTDTAETNEFMRNDLDIIDYNKITPNQLQTGFQKILVDYDAEVNSLFSTFQNNNLQETTFDDVFVPLEKSFASLDYGYKKARHFSFIYPYTKYHTGFPKIEYKINITKNERWTNKNFYKVLKHLDSNKHLLNDAQKRILERSLRNCVLNGLNLDEAKFQLCREFSNKIQETQNMFRHRLDYANRKFGIRVSDQMPLNDIPVRIKKMIAVDPENPNKGPWTILSEDNVIESFFKYSGNRNLRKAIAEAFYSRASYVSEQFQTNNSEIIKDLVRYRNDQAKFYGYKNFAEMVIENNSAVKVENVIEMFEKIKTNIKPVADESVSKLQKYSANHGNLSQLEYYDLEYWKTKHTSQYYPAESNGITEYFPYQKVLSGLFDLCKLLFNIEFKEENSTKEKLWHPSVVVYNVHDENGKHISTLVIDPFIRAKKIDSIWSYSGRESSLIANAKPLVYLSLNVRDSEGSKSTLSFDQVKKLFYEFGGVTQTLLTSTNFTDTSDKNSIELDAANLNNQLFEKLVYIPEIIKLISAHINTGEPVPNDIITVLKNGSSNFNSLNLMKKAMLSAFDIESHISKEFWADIYTQIWPKFMSTKLSENDYRPCQFVSIYGHNFGCTYYSLIWSEMLVADLFDAFKTVGFENKTAIKDLGVKYRDTILKNGSSISSNDKFTMFRGRNPSMDPFIKSYLPKSN